MGGSSPVQVQPGPHHETWAKGIKAKTNKQTKRYLHLYKMKKRQDMPENKKKNVKKDEKEANTLSWASNGQQ